MGVSKRGLRSIHFPALRFRGKIMLGFAVVLAITAVSMGIAWLGFEHVSAGVSAYRKSVAEADLARNIDRELISYRSLVRYYVATGKEEDSKAAIAAEAGLKDAIDQSMRGTANPARLEQVTKLEREFRAFTKIFAEILKTKEESDYLTKNALMRSEMSLEYKLDDLASAATEDGLEDVAFQAKTISTQFQAIKVFTNNFVVSGDPSAATSTTSRLSFLENAFKNIPAAHEKIAPVVKEMNALLKTYR
jgi:CHASE3 domain sensor protein